MYVHTFHSISLFANNNAVTTYHLKVASFIKREIPFITRLVSFIAAAIFTANYHHHTPVCTLIGINFCVVRSLTTGRDKYAVG